MPPPAGQAIASADGAVLLSTQEQQQRREPSPPRTPDESQEVECQLERLKLEGEHAANVPRTKPLAVATAVHVKAAFGELLATSPTQLIMQPGTGDGGVEEAKMWDAFAQVYCQELCALQDGGDDELPKERKRQILADILVWAEITQAHYDSNTASFVTEPHGGDASFQRIGRLLKAAKDERGLH